MEIPGGRGSNVKPSEMENPGGVGIFSVNTQNKTRNKIKNLAKSMRAP